MRDIDFKWECPACEGSNPTTVVKPTLYKSTLITRPCAICDSKFLIRVMKERGRPGIVGYAILSGDLSAKGRRMHTERTQNTIEVKATKPAIAE